MKHTLDQALGPPSEAEFGGREVTEQTITHLQNAFNASNPGFSQFQDAWNTQEDSQSDVSDALSAGGYNRARGIWNHQGQHSLGIGTNVNDVTSFDKSYGDLLQGSNPMSQEANRFLGGSSLCSSFAANGTLQTPRVLSGPSVSPYSLYCRSPAEQSPFPQAPNSGPRRALTHGNRGGTFFPAPSAPWCQFNSGPPTDPVLKSPTSPIAGSSASTQPIGIYQAPPYHPRPVATPLSPTATEFTAQPHGNLWLNSPVSIVGSWVVNHVRLIFTRHVEVLSRHMSHRTNHSITGASSTKMSHVTGNTL